MLIDYRCPRCNKPVKGRIEIDIVKAVPKTFPKECKNCHTPISRYKTKPGDGSLVDYAFLDTSAVYRN